MALTLYHNDASPFVRKVMILLHETKQIKDVATAPAVGHALDQSKMPIAENPLGKIPTLIRSDGPALYDSRVICRFFDERVQAGLYGQGARLWANLTIEATADGIMDSVMLIVTEGRVRPTELQFDPWIEAQWDKAARAITSIEQRWLSHLAGPFSIAHISVGAALGYVDFRQPDRDWRVLAPQLGKWFDEMCERPSFKATQPQG